MAVGRHVITLRRGGRCAACGSGLLAGAQAWWDPADRSTVCTECAPPAGPLPGVAVPLTARSGADAGRGRRNGDPLDGPVAILPYANDADREDDDEVAVPLDGLAGNGIEVLHRRRAPDGYGLDHLVIGPSGVYVVETQRCGGPVAKRDVGGWFRRDVRLYVGPRDYTRLVDETARKADTVRAELDGVPVTPVLCFLDAEWALLARPIVLHGVHALSPKATVALVRRAGPLAADRVAAVAGKAAAAFPPCSA